MFWNCDKVALSLEVMHLAKVKSDLITAAMREGPLISLAVGVRQRRDNAGSLFGVCLFFNQKRGPVHTVTPLITDGCRRVAVITTVRFSIVFGPMCLFYRNQAL